MIGGFLAESTIDYPGKLASVIFTRGCYFRCPYCHNPELVEITEDEEYTTKEVLKLLESNALIDGVVITGGEPTLWCMRLIDLIYEIRALGLSVKLDTNGSNPFWLARAIEAGVDYVAMDIKSSLLDYKLVYSDNLQFLVNMEGSIKTIRNNSWLENYEFRHTCVHPFSDNLVKDFPTVLKGIDNFYLQEARLDGPLLNKHFPMSALTKEEMKKLGEELETLKYVKTVHYRWNN